MIQVKIKKLQDGFIMPARMSPHAACFDLYAAISGTMKLLPSMVAYVPCGFSIEVPLNHEAQIRSRSGLAKDDKVFVINSPGTIDADYRGEVGVLLLNASQNFTFILHPRTRIAQMVIKEVPQVELILSEELSETERGTGGFGSTGRMK